MMAENSVLLDIDERGVAKLTINRPEIHNAFDDALINRLIQALEAVDADPNVRVLIGCGEAETEAFKSQSRDYAEACRAAGIPIEVFESPDANHFQIIGDYGSPGTPLFDRHEKLVRQT